MRDQQILVIDPGTDKSGVAILNRSGEVIVKAILFRQEFKDQLLYLDQRYQPIVWVVGNKNAGREIRELAQKINRRHVPVVLQDEHRSSEEGRQLYWQAKPPTGLKRLIPTSFQVPREPWDDWAAVVIGRRWLKENSCFKNKSNE